MSVLLSDVLEIPEALQPWVEQWHADVDPTYGVRLAAFCREQLTARAAPATPSASSPPGAPPHPPAAGG